MVSKGKNILNRRFVHQVIDSMAEGVFTLDEAGRISSWNPSMEKITGYTAEAALGKTCDMLQFSRCINKVCPTGLKECGLIKRGKTEPKECHLRHRDGHDVPVIKNARLVRDEDGRILGVVETVNDLSELSEARRMAEEAARRLGEMFTIGNLIGKSRPMQDVFVAIRAAAASDAAVLIQGESGTGKELVAGAIHHNSSRAGKPLVTVNCAALSESLLESELVPPPAHALSRMPAAQITHNEDIRLRIISNLLSLAFLFPWAHSFPSPIYIPRETAGQSKSPLIKIGRRSHWEKSLIALLRSGLLW